MKKDNVATTEKFAKKMEDTVLSLSAQVSKLSQTQSELVFCINNIAKRPVVYMVRFESDVCRITEQMTIRLLRVSRLIRVKQYAIRKLKNKLRTAH